LTDLHFWSSETLLYSSALAPLNQHLFPNLKKNFEGTDFKHSGG
jgi:hypothetical protein